MKIESISIDRFAVEVPERKRRLNDQKVKELADSITKIGLLQPIIVCAAGAGKWRLVAGLHRLKAFELNKERFIPANVVGADQAELMEIDENLLRNELTVLEQGLHLKRRNEILEAMGERANPWRPDKGETVSPLLTTAEIASQAGLSERSAQQRLQIANEIEPDVIDRLQSYEEISDSTTQLLALARMGADEQRQAVGMVESGEAHNIKDAARKISHSEKRERVLPPGRYQVIYADPPWKYDNSGFDEAADNQYPTMELEEICALPVNRLADETSVLFLWATNPLLQEALQVIKSWGFEYKTNMAWIKDRGRGKGWFLKSKHELLLIAVKPETPHPLQRPDSCFEAERGMIHSRKPEMVYGIIEAMYPGGKIELFARECRAGWDNWGNEL